MVKSFIRGLSRWPSTDLGELLGLIAAEIHNRAEHKANYERAKSKPVAGRPAK